MAIRLKLVKRKEEQINTISKLVHMLKMPGFPPYEYQPVGGSSLLSNLTTVTTIDPRIQAQKNLFEMFHLAR